MALHHCDVLPGDGGTVLAVEGWGGLTDTIRI
jgi:hypothetical protein